MAHKKKVLIIFVEGTPEWMISFGDLLSCLLVFFILLLTFSSAQSGKMMDMVGESETPGAPGDRTAGDLPGESGREENIAVDPESLSPMKIESLLISNTFLDFKTKILNLGFKESVSVRDLSDGIMVTIPLGKLFVDEKQTELTRNGTGMIEALANVIKSIGNELRISLVFPKDAAIQGLPLQNGMRQITSIQESLSAKYHIPFSRVSFGSPQRNGEQELMFTFLIASKIEDKLMTVDEFIRKKH